MPFAEADVVFWFEADAEDCRELDELDAAMLKGPDVCDWPSPAAEGYADYVP